MLSIRNLFKLFKHTQAIDDVSFDLERGHSLLLLGPNGAGKTTIIRCILGLLNYRGRIEVDGHDARAEGVEVRRQIGYVPQEFAFYDTLTVNQQARFIADLKGVDYSEIRTRLDEVGMWENRDKNTRALSSGMRQRLGLALALMGGPPLLLFDEPTSNVDLRGQLEFQRLVAQFKSEGKTILVTTHLSSLHDLADEAVVMNKGQIVATGTPKDLLRKMNVMDTIYVKLGNGNPEGLIKILESAGAIDVTDKAGWVVGSVTPDRKASLLKELLQKYDLGDLVVESTSLESQYFRLFSGAERS